MDKQWIEQKIKEAHELFIENGDYECDECNEDGVFVDGVLESGFDVECPNCNGTGIDPSKNTSKQKWHISGV